MKKTITLLPPDLDPEIPFVIATGKTDEARKGALSVEETAATGLALSLLTGDSIRERPLSAWQTNRFFHTLNRQIESE